MQFFIYISCINWIRTCLSRNEILLSQKILEQNMVRFQESCIQTISMMWRPSSQLGHCKRIELPLKVARSNESSVPICIIFVVGFEKDVLFSYEYNRSLLYQRADHMLFQIFRHSHVVCLMRHKSDVKKNMRIFPDFLYIYF